jgi:hypothetical protein
MTKKKRKRQAEQPPKNDTAEQPSDLAENASVEGGADVSASESESLDEDAPQSTDSGDEVSVDDLLDDVRRSLIEDEAQGEEKKPGWLSRIAKGFQKDRSVDESPMEAEPMMAVPDVPVEQPNKNQYVDEIDELIEMLEPEIEEAEPAPPSTAEVAPLPPMEVRADIDELKKQVFSPPEDVEEQDIRDEVRAAALEDGEDVFVEVEAKRASSAEGSIKAFENSLRPYRQSIYFAIAIVGVVVAVLAAGIMYTAYQREQPPATPPNVSNQPNPVAMTLPGGLNFNLGRGSLEDGRWNPVGPEWLTGTEICRWIAIPWSRQLEAVVRTLNQEDTIELAMSNSDRLEYSVYSIQQLTLEEMQALDQNTPCLLLVLAEQDAEERWVVIAKP